MVIDYFLKRFITWYPYLLETVISLVWELFLCQGYFLRTTICFKFATNLLLIRHDISTWIYFDLLFFSRFLT